MISIADERWPQSHFAKGVPQTAKLSKSILAYCSLEWLVTMRYARGELDKLGMEETYHIMIRVRDWSQVLILKALNSVVSVELESLN